MQRAIGALVFVLATATGCQDIRTVEISHYMRSCVGVDVQLCYVSDEEGLTYGGLAGWSFEWGFNHTLEVEVEDVDDPEADGSSIAYTLHSVISKERVAVGTSFSFSVFDPVLLTETAPDAYTILGGPTIDCASRDLCDELTAARSAVAPCFELLLSHPASSEEALLLEEITPTPGAPGC